MSSGKIRVGFIGLNPDSQWAFKSHLPALQLLSDDFEITGVANSTPESARRTATALHIPHAFNNPQALIQSPEVDLVVVTVKVPHHFELVKAALEAGKHVYCEHPLGNGLEETQQLATLAKNQRVVAVIGTQMVVAPAVRYLAQLIKEGYVGKVLSTTLIGSGGNWGSVTVANNYYLFDKANGATMLTIPLGHTLAGLTAVLGGFAQLTAQLTSNFTMVKVQDTTETKPKTAADQILVQGTLASGAAISIHYRGGVSRGTNLLWEINGTEGDIQVTGPLGHGQLTPLTIRGARGDEKELTPLVPPAALYSGLPDNPVVGNVAQLYKLLAADIRNNTCTAPSFADALVLHQLLDSIEQSAQG
ncbi:Gfo/Idh/MocA family oxidoreductase [Hymenobacter sp. YC55]|uniref:Gfo/Idh/MocA family protein n=1 Tax=Hymenobacter sp. YC55 TaxID=3034019 RepID=UPI0023F9870E|nr:Gfo/Idh/MocA family oxidoreductase [Hymenobacter sp. YC55]MDF7814098.1 Gfo/Idh/MocA family oxidoreductase [Hymenobacter sp. YC55]